MNIQYKFTLKNETTQTEYELNSFSGSIGPDVIDMQTLYERTGLFSYDPGFTSTASCTSKITFIDGDAGILLYRGYPIEELAEHCTFLEVCYLLLNGELPNEEQLYTFTHQVTVSVIFL